MKYPFLSASVSRILIIIISLFCAISAFGGGAGLIFTNGLGMPLENLHGVFPSFLVPGLILFLIVGGTCLTTAILAIKKSNWFVDAAVVAGFGLQIWVISEIYIIQDLHWLQLVYFIAGTLLLILSFANLRSNQ